MCRGGGGDLLKVNVRITMCELGARQAGLVRFSPHPNDQESSGEKLLGDIRGHVIMGGAVRRRQ